jgi:hypothetical protein
MVAQDGSGRKRIAQDRMETYALELSHAIRERHTDTRRRADGTLGGGVIGCAPPAR